MDASRLSPVDGRANIAGLLIVKNLILVDPTGGTKVHLPYSCTALVVDGRFNSCRWTLHEPHPR